MENARACAYAYLYKESSLCEYELAKDLKVSDIDFVNRDFGNHQVIHQKFIHFFNLNSHFIFPLYQDENKQENEFESQFVSSRYVC